MRNPRFLTAAVAFALALAREVQADPPRPPATPSATQGPKPLTVGIDQRVELTLTTGHAPSPSAFVREVRAITLPPGRSRVIWTGLADAAVLESATMAATGARLVSQEVRSHAILEDVRHPLLVGTEVAATDLGGGSPGHPHAPPVRGTLVSLSGGVVLHTREEFTALGPSHLEAPPLPSRTIVFDLEVPPGEPAKVSLEVAAPFEKLDQRTPHYALRLDSAGNRGSLSGGAIFVNRTGYPLNGAHAVIAHQMMNLPMDWALSSASSWTSPSLDRHPKPFPIRAPLEFDPTLVADGSLIEATGLPISQTLVVEPNVAGLFERQDWPTSFDVTRVLSVDTEKANLPAPLPPGSVVVHRVPDPVSGPLQVGRGTLRQDEMTTPTLVSLKEPSFPFVAARQKSAQRITTCRATATWSIDIPNAARAEHPVVLYLNGKKDALSVKLRGKSTAKLVVEPSRVVITLPPQAPRDAKSPGNETIVLDLRMRDCL